MPIASAVGFHGTIANLIAFSFSTGCANGEVLMVIGLKMTRGCICCWLLELLAPSAKILLMVDPGGIAFELYIISAALCLNSVLLRRPFLWSMSIFAQRVCAATKRA